MLGVGDPISDLWEFAARINQLETNISLEIDLHLVDQPGVLGQPYQANKPSGSYSIRRVEMPHPPWF